MARPAETAVIIPLGGGLVDITRRVGIDSTRLVRGIVAGFFIAGVGLQVLSCFASDLFSAPRASVRTAQACLACLDSFDLKTCHLAAVDLASRHDYTTAIELESRIRRLLPHNAEVAAALAHMHHVGRRDTVQAIALYHAALGALPGYPPALFGLGTIMEEKGEIAIAERYFARGAREHPDMAVFKVRLAEVLVSAGRDDRARPVLQEIVQRWPGTDDARRARKLLSRTALARP